MLNNFAKFIQEQLDPTPEKFDPEEGIEQEDDESRLPQAKVAIFWDYENFPIPKDINDHLFFETLFSSSNEERIVTKRVYAKEETIANKLKVIKENGFEYIQGLLSGKKNAVDHQLMTDCIKFCSKRLLKK